MRPVASVVLAAAGVVLLVRGNLGGVMVVVMAILVAWPGLTLITLPARREAFVESEGVPPSRRARLVAWALAAVLLSSLLIGAGLLGFFVLGEGSVAGLVLGASMVVLSVRALYRMEPRGS